MIPLCALKTPEQLSNDTLHIYTVCIHTWIYACTISTARTLNKHIKIPSLLTAVFKCIWSRSMSQTERTRLLAAATRAAGSARDRLGQHTGSTTVSPQGRRCHKRVGRLKTFSYFMANSNLVSKTKKHILLSKNNYTNALNKLRYHSDRYTILAKRVNGTPACTT